MTASYTVVVICEGSMDREVAKSLSLKVLFELVDWLTEESLRFKGLEDPDAFQSWAGLKSRKGAVPRRGGFDPEWGPDSATAWKALHFANDTKPDGVILLRDCDGAAFAQKRAEIAAAVQGFRRTIPADRELPIAVGVANAKIEGWLLASIEPAGKQLTWRTELKQELGFDPVTQAEELNSTDNVRAKRNAKAVLARVMNLAEALDAIEAAPIRRLLSQGARTGLPEFLRDLRCELGRLVLRRVPDIDWCRCPVA